MTEVLRLPQLAKASGNLCRFLVNQSGNPFGRPVDGPAACAGSSIKWRVGVRIPLLLACIFPVIYRRRLRRGKLTGPARHRQAPPCLEGPAGEGAPAWSTPWSPPRRPAPPPL